MTAPPLVLASGSRYRAELLARLRVPFEAVAPDVDETPAPGESAASLAQRLARAKAAAVAARRPEAWVLASDQAVGLGTGTLGKPGSAEAARTQLARMAGSEVRFETAVVLLANGRSAEALDTTRVRFRPLTAAEIDRYVAAEPALDCAGAFKAEGLGISLMESLQTSDPTALIGLPLIAVRRLLAQAGRALP